VAAARAAAARDQALRVALPVVEAVPAGQRDAGQEIGREALRTAVQADARCSGLPRRAALGVGALGGAG
jgi:hypothetical protein